MQNSGPQAQSGRKGGIVADPVEEESVSKQPSGAVNTDSNPDKV